MSDNPRVIMIAAPPSSGKTHSLYKLASDPGVAYLNKVMLKSFLLLYRIWKKIAQKFIQLFWIQSHF
jgi:hypothetical protein